MMIVGKGRSTEEIESAEIMSSIGQEVYDTKPRTLSMNMSCPGESNVGCIPPVWWFQHFDPCWAPLRKWLSRKKTLTLTEFQLITDRASGFRSIEKIIAVSAFVSSKHMQ
ncbi:MAG: hypothetical protein OEV99_16195 [Nitrospira sp.]|nr:hypothetical protein [Nitrospira sp.]MDH4371364.1 hypothetical protein [Nitrospira sp.]MDH5499013.1 hypothetical protein [Nitrospira sp.]